MAVAELLDEEIVDYTVNELPQGFEFVNGELLEKPNMGFAASWVASELHGVLKDHLKFNRVGITITADASFKCFSHKPDQIRKPDVSVLLCDPSTFVPPDPHCLEVPAIVVEVISPREVAYDLDDKIDDFLKAGTRLVWVIHPVKRRVVIHYPDLTTRQANEDGLLTGEDVLPGFSIPLATILPKKI